MKLSEVNILILAKCMRLGGTENAILQTCEILNPFVNQIIVCSSGGINETKLEKLGIKHITINEITTKNPLKIISNIVKIRKIIKKYNINVIHSHHRMAALYANICGNKRTIKIANAHNTFYDKKIMTKLSYNNTNVIAVGEQVKNNLVNYYYIPEDRVHVIHNAIKKFDEKIIKVKEFVEDRKSQKKVVVNVGRLSEQKGMEYYISAIELLTQRKISAKFYIIGTGPDESKLKKLVEEKKLNKYVKFLGFRNDIQNVLSQVDLCVLSSLWEGLPLTPIEAFSVKKTIVATSVDGTPEIISNMNNGILVSPRNIEELADKIEWVLENEECRKKMEVEAYRTYENEFSFEILSKKYVEFYKKIIK